MQFHFDRAELKELVAVIAAELIPTIIERVKQPDRPIWSHADLAKMLGVTSQTLHEYRESGKIRASKPGKSYNYSREAVIKFLADCEVN